MRRVCRPRLLSRGLLGFALVLALVIHAEAVVLVDSGGFESFASGTIEGQQGWLSAGFGSSAATVQSAVVKSGSQALRVDRASNSDRYWAKLISDPPLGRYVSIDWDMRVEATGASGVFGPFFGVNTIDDSNGPVGVSAGFGLDATTGELLYQEGGSGVLVPGPVVPLGAWAHYRIELDFGTDTYKTFYNGSFIASTGFVDASLGLDRLTDADIVALAADGGAASQALAGVAYFDNFVVRDGVRGDYNDDGRVDAADYTVWRDTNGTTGFGLAADGDANGVVNSLDYDLWKAAYGALNVSGPAIAVPEPSSCVAAMLALTALASRRQSFA